MRWRAVSADSLRLWPSKTATKLLGSMLARLAAQGSLASGISSATMTCRSWSHMSTRVGACQHDPTP